MAHDVSPMTPGVMRSSLRSMDSSYSPDHCRYYNKVPQAWQCSQQTNCASCPTRRNMRFNFTSTHIRVIISESTALSLSL